MIRIQILTLRVLRYFSRKLDDAMLALLRAEQRRHPKTTDCDDWCSMCGIRCSSCGRP